MKRSLVFLAAVVTALACVEATTPCQPPIVGPGCRHEARYYTFPEGKLAVLVSIWYAQCPDSTPPVYTVIPDTTFSCADTTSGQRAGRSR